MSKIKCRPERTKKQAAKTVKVTSHTRSKPKRISRRCGSR